jgi:hypothetical protein
VALTPEEALAEALKKGHEKFATKTLVFGSATNVRERLFDVKRNGEATLIDVSLTAFQDATSYLLIKPKENSAVIVGIINNSEEQACIIQASEVDKLSVKINTVEVIISADGVVVKKDQDNLKDVLTLMVDAVKQITVLYGNNPNYLKLQQAQTKINNLLK